MDKIRLVMAALAAAALATGLAIGQPVLAAGGTQVLMVDNEPDLTNWHFEPREVTVPAGSTVLWHNKGHEEHSVTADNKSFDSGYRRQGADFQRTFSRPGNYAYHCAPHPWMTGVVRVVAAVPTTTAETTPATTATTSAPTTTTTPSAAPPTTMSAPSPAAVETTTSAAEATAAPAPGTSEEAAAAPAASRRPSRPGSGLPGTIALVVGPTLAGLALGARLRRKP